VVYDPARDQILFGKNPDARRGMASTTKIMTAALALSLYDRAQTVKLPRNWLGAEGSSMYLKPGERVTVDDLLHGVMLLSGNDAALALSTLLTGDPADFLAAMNAQAAQLGLENTAFENASGLDGEGHYSTAADMARLTAWALENPDFAALCATQAASKAGRSMRNHNRLLWELDGCIGVKTGYTKASGRCLVSACTRQGRTLIVVTLGDPDDWRDHAALYDAAFAGLDETIVCKPGAIGEVPIAGESQAAQLYIQQGYAALLSDAERPALRVSLCGPRMHYGATRAGDRWGTLVARVGDAVIFETDVYFAADFTPKTASWLEKIWNWFR
jgi:D-alanyl-D-alanine carboxypeptidase